MPYDPVPPPLLLSSAYNGRCRMKAILSLLHSSSNNDDDDNDSSWNIVTHSLSTSLLARFVSRPGGLSCTVRTGHPSAGRHTLAWAHRETGDPTTHAPAGEQNHQPAFFSSRHPCCCLSICQPGRPGLSSLEKSSYFVSSSSCPARQGFSRLNSSFDFSLCAPTSPLDRHPAGPSPSRPNITPSHLSTNKTTAPRKSQPPLRLSTLGLPGGA